MTVPMNVISSIAQIPANATNLVGQDGITDMQNITATAWQNIDQYSHYNH